MHLKLFAVVLALAMTTTVLSAPHGKANSRDLEGKFEQFLAQDKEFQALVHSPNGLKEGANLIRHVRQAEGELEGTDLNVDMEGEKKPGFFDRAAKFVVELLQRFLKWVNSSDNQ